MRLASLSVVLLATVPAAHAIDAVTYNGTLGGLDIVLELTYDGSGNAVGRYSYMNKGGDIPLNALNAADGAIAFSEEAPCTADTCVAGDDGEITDKPVGATWVLEAGADGKLVGTWTAEGKSKGLDVTLFPIALRTLPDDTALTPSGLHDSVANQIYAADAFRPEIAPYEFAKMDVALSEGPVMELDGSSFVYVTDPRSQFAFPRVVSLADGSSPDAVNDALSRRHALINYNAFDCLGQVYGGFGGRGDMLDMGAGTLADYDSENVTLGYLSPTLVGWTEAGSTFCRGAYPNNHFDSYIVETKTGAPFAMGRVFKGITANVSYLDYEAVEIDQAAALADPANYGWEMSQELIDYVIANRTPNADAEMEAECGIDELIANNLGIRFAPGDQVIFSLTDLPHVMFACGDDLLTVALADIPELLTPEAKEYFPALAQ